MIHDISSECRVSDTGQALDAEEEEDSVIHEIDVYITRALGKLVLAQYPLRPTYKPYKTAVREGLRVRPVQQDMELDMKLQTNPNKPPQVQKLRVSQRPLLKPNAAIGLIKGRELHLAPLDGVLQLIPSFDHIDKRVAEDAKLNEKEASSTATPAQSVTRKFSKVESDRDRALRLSSYENVQQERCKESWVPCDYRPPEHPYTAGQKRAILKKQEDGGVAGSEVAKTRYLDMLMPPQTAHQFSDNKPVGLRDLPDMPIPKQVATLMRNAHVLSFDEIRDALPNIPCPELITELQDCAHLVQGNWVVGSKLVYPKGTRSEHTGVPAELMVKHRDFVLHCFYTSCLVKRRHLQSICKIPPVEVEEILKQVSVQTPIEGWTFKRPPCPDFNLEYPALTESQRNLWSDIYQELYTSFHLKSHRNNPLVENQKPGTDKNAGVKTELTNISEEVAAQIVERLQSDGVIKPDTLFSLTSLFRDVIGPGAVLVNVLEEAMTRFVPDPWIKPVLSEMCAALRICYISILTQEGEKEEALGYEKIGSVSDKYRQVVFSLFETRYQVSRTDLRDAILQHLQVGVTNKEFNSVISVLCEPVCKSRFWTLKVNRRV